MSLYINFVFGSNINPQISYYNNNTPFFDNSKIQIYQCDFTRMMEIDNQLTSSKINPIENQSSEENNNFNCNFFNISILENSYIRKLIIYEKKLHRHKFKMETIYNSKNFCNITKLSRNDKNNFIWYNKKIYMFLKHFRDIVNRDLQWLCNELDTLPIENEEDRILIFKTKQMLFDALNLLFSLKNHNFKYLKNIYSIIKKNNIYIETFMFYKTKLDLISFLDAFKNFLWGTIKNDVALNRFQDSYLGFLRRILFIYRNIDKNVGYLKTTNILLLKSIK